MKKLDFLVCGVQKAGTSTLHALLARHPGIAVPRGKELHFFDNDKRDWRNPDYQRYEAIFGGAAASRAWGECTPSYIYFPDAPARIRAYNPSIRLIVVFRDPAERAYSHWCMAYANGNESLSFADAIRVRAGAGQDDRAYSYVKRGYYGAQLERLLGLFSSEQILILEFEDLIRRQFRTMDRVLSFLGVPDRTSSMGDPVHSRRRPAFNYPSVLTDQDRSYLREVYADDQELLARLLARHGLTNSGHRHASIEQSAAAVRS